MRADTSSQTVDLDAVSMTYAGRLGPVKAIEEFSLSIRAGEFVSLLGPSGCGKSTLLKIIAGLIPATGGAVSVGGDPVDGARTDIGFVFQQPVLLDWRTVLENVMLQIEARRLPRDVYLPKAMELLDKVGLKPFAGSHPYELSGGMMQRASVCRALVHEPPLLLMDEPFGALDALTRDQMMIDLQRLWIDRPKTVLFVTHSVPEAIFLSDRVLVLSPRPARIARVIEIDIPRPRRLAERGSTAYAAYQAEILEIFAGMGIIRED